MKNYNDRIQGNTCSTDFEKHRQQLKNSLFQRFHDKRYVLNYLERAIVEESDSDVLFYISGYLNLKMNARSIILTTSCYSYLDHVDFDNVRAIINLEPAKQAGQPDKLLKAVNTLLPDAGIYIGLFHESSDAMELCTGLADSGFDIIDISIINGLFYFTALKTSAITHSC